MFLMIIIIGGALLLLALKAVFLCVAGDVLDDTVERISDRGDRN